jgi:hypothetical protein
VNVRDKKGHVILQPQVSTRWEKIREFLAQLQQQAAPEGGFMAILEVCGFNDWFIKLLREYGCREIVLIQAEKLAHPLSHHRKRLTLQGRSTGAREQSDTSVRPSRFAPRNFRGAKGTTAN